MDNDYTTEILVGEEHQQGLETFRHSMHEKENDFFLNTGNVFQ